MEKELTDRQLLTSYKQELDTLGYTPQTVFAKIRNLINFKIITQKPYQETTETALEFYCIYLQKKELHSNTIKHYYHNVSQFFIYLEREHIISKNPFNFYDLQLIKQAKNTREIINQQEVKQLYKVAKKGKQTLLLHLCYGCGLRAKELEQINIEDVLLTKQLIKVAKGKNSQYRVIPIPTTILKDITTYVKNRNKQNTRTKALLLNQKGERLKAYTARSILQGLLEQTLITKTITLHSLRHSIATHLLQNGIKVEYVQEFLGHKQLETTEVYTRITKEQLKNLQ